MAITVEFNYGVRFGPGDASDVLDWEATIDGEAEAAYLEAKEKHIAFEEYPVLKKLLEDVTKEIADTEIDNFIDYDDDYVRECTGRYEVDPDDINELVANRDPYTLEYFGLTEMTDEELDEWDACDLDELPEVCDFEEDFVEQSPFDCGWDLNVDFAEHPEEDEE